MLQVEFCLEERGLVLKVNNLYSIALQMLKAHFKTPHPENGCYPNWNLPSLNLSEPTSQLSVIFFTDFPPIS